MGRLLIIILVFLFACSSPVKQKENERVSNYTVFFEKYLEKTFQEKIPAKRHYFILIPSKGCPSCRNAEVKDFLKILEKPSVTLVVAENVANSLKLIPNVEKNNLLIDQHNFIDKQNLPFEAFTGMYTTENGEIINITQFNYQNYKEVFKEIR